MQLFIYLILFFYLFIQHSSTSNYLLCTSQCTQLTVPFSDPLTLPDDCPGTGNQSDNALVCVLTYRVDYDTRNVYLQLKASNETSIFKNDSQSEHLHQIIWLGFSKDAHQSNITQRKYECRTGNDCAREFYNKTVQYLINDGKQQLDQISNKLYKQTPPIRKVPGRRCKENPRRTNQSSVQCSYGLCYAHNIDGKQGCSTDGSATFFSEIELYLPKVDEEPQMLVEYRCNRHLCNKNQTLEDIQTMLGQYTNWNPLKIEEKSSSSSIAILPIRWDYSLLCSVIILRFQL